MKRFMLLAAMCAAFVLVLTPVAGAQGNDISCPEGSAANAAGNTCTDLETGQQVEPISSNIVFPLQEGSNPCPESSPGNIYTFEGGVCVLNGESLTQYAPTSVPEAIDEQTPSTTTTTPLPDTGGPSLALLAGTLLIGAGLVLRRR